MTTQHDKPKRWRPRFSVRTLAIVVTLVCCYAACWGPTKRRGIEDALQYEYGTPATASGFEAAIEADDDDAWDPALLRRLSGVAGFDPSPAAPLIVRIDELSYANVRTKTLRRTYYFWFFGYVAKLPWEREIPADDPSNT